jgi:hypothetical protein
MAINVKLTKDPEAESRDLTTYAIYEFPGLTSTGTRFILDAEATGLTSWYLFDISLGEYVAYSGDPNSEYINTLPVESPTANSISLFNYYVNDLLNSAAISYGYYSIDNAVSYYNSLDPTKREEARSFSDWRDSVLSLADTNIYGFTADGITLPDLAGFTGQTGYIDFSVIGIPTTLVGDENAGYHITDLENKIFTAWTKSNSDSSGFGTIQIPFPSGQIKNIYSITGLVDQGGLTSNWLTSDYTIKIKMSGTQNSFGTYTEFDYKINDVENNTVSYSDIHLRFNIIGGF